MSDVVREAVAQAIYRTQYPNCSNAWDEVGEDGHAVAYVFADAAIAAYLSALGEGGYTLIKHPEPDDTFADGIREWYCDQWFVGTDKRGTIRVLAHKMNLRPKTAGRLAAAILAAAAEAEK